MKSFIRNLVVGFVLACALVPAAQAQTSRQKIYPSAEEAFAALVGAMRSGKTEALLGVLGSDARSLLFSGDKVADAQGREQFVKLYEEGGKLETSGDKAVLSIGKDGWPFPIPVVKDAAGWRFDTKAGREELLNRRVGRNELFTMQAALAYVDAQREYYLRNPQNAKLHQYAQKVVSSAGKRDGLYFPTKAGEPASPLGPRFDAAKKAGYSGEGGGTYHGYRYRILKSQGADAPGGAYGYVAKGAMIGGHAIVAWPAIYGNSGVKSFLVSHDGVLYEKDLGPQTGAEAQKITRFNPDKTWKAIAK